MKKIISLCCAFLIVFSTIPAKAQSELITTSKSVLLMEQSTKQVLYENNADEQLPIASVTKIMTMLLIMEAIDSGKITMEDEVCVSERAMSMGGSTMFLETGEILSVYEMLKGIAVASANDACVAMAEFISGSEETFVGLMNERAKELGMKNTNFVNTNGLDADNHYSSARDVALMSAELLNHEKIFEFTTIWTDKMHNGQFDLSNTNKLIRFYPGANGLKTGSTSKALCCLSATAKREEMQLIAVVLAAPTSQDRFSDAKKLLDYGFGNYQIKIPVNENEEVAKVPVILGEEKEIAVVSKSTFSFLASKGDNVQPERKIVITKEIKAPVKKGDVLGEIEIYRGEEKIGSTELISASDVSKKGFFLYFKEIFMMLFS